MYPLKFKNIFKLFSNHLIILNTFGAPDLAIPTSDVAILFNASIFNINFQ
jgi:hypothetical protein